MKNLNESSRNIPNILVVDDVSANLKLLDDILKSEGYKTRPVPNGELALRAVTKEKPDLILLDIMMPGMDGFEVCRHLKKNDDLKDIPVIFISALGETDDIVKALAMGGVDYINKPFHAEEVKARVHTHLKIGRQRKELMELNATKDKFFSIIAHDLRGPFNGFLGLTKIMAEESQNLTRDEIQQYAASMSNTASNLFQLLENLLEWSLIQRGLKGYGPVSSLLMPAITESIQPVMDSANKKGIMITCEIPSDLDIFADTDMLASIIRNLTSNSIKFTQKGGTITIAAKTVNDNFIEISVKDTGIGMNSTMVENLFRLDVQTNRKGTEGEPSSGLGLNLSKDFIEKHGGKIWAESIVGQGSTFYFTIPWLPARKEKDAVKHDFTAAETQHPLKKLKILIAEDDITSDFLLTMAVKKISSEILHANNGADAVAVCFKHPDIDLILMDIDMPFMEGNEATSDIRQFNKDVIIIAQTAKVLFGERNKALEAGCNDYISKPIDQKELMNMIRKYFK
jgi:CheY-like chemotaxis protein